MALILPTGELCFELVVFNRRQHQHQDLMGGLLLSLLFLLTAILTYAPLVTHKTPLAPSSVMTDHAMDVQGNALMLTFMQFA